MDSRNVVTIPTDEDMPTVASATTAKEMITALYKEAENRKDSELMSRISEVQGLHTAEIRVRALIDAYVQYLDAQGKRPQTVKIYKSKIAAVLPGKEGRIRLEDVRWTLREYKTEDHNLRSAIKNFLEFIDGLL